VEANDRGAVGVNALLVEDIGIVTEDGAHSHSGDDHTLGCVTRSTLGSAHADAAWNMNADQTGSSDHCKINCSAWKTPVYDDACGKDGGCYK
jgi:hypothetical protein